MENKKVFYCVAQHTAFIEAESEKKAKEIFIDMINTVIRPQDFEITVEEDKTF